MTRYLLFVESEIVEQKAASGRMPGSFDGFGWGLGVSVVTWRVMKAVVAANRCAPDLDALVQQAVAWLAALSPYDRLRCSGLLSIKFQWLST